MGKLVGYAERSWVDKSSGELKERMLLWCSKKEDRLTGEAFEELMVRKDQLPPDLSLGDDLIVIRDNRGFIKDIIRLPKSKT